MKRLFISSDMEGTTGITSWDETEWGDPRNGYFLQQMTNEVNAACEAANDAGFEEIWVKDAHDSGRNIIPSGLPENVKLLRGWIGDTYSMMGGIDRADGKFDAALMTGYHSWASCDGNPLSHTMHTSLNYVKINDTFAPEFMINAYIAGYHGVPVCFLSGDEALCEFAKTIVPGITTVAVNRGIGDAVLSINPNLAVKKIKEGVYSALSADYSKCMVNMPDKFKLEIGFKEHATAFSRQKYPGVEMTSTKEIRYYTDDWAEAMRFFSYCL